LAKVIDGFAGDYIATQPVLGFTEPLDLESRIRQIALSGRLNRNATPGYCFLDCSNVGQVVDGHLEELVLYVTHFIDVLMRYSPAEFAALTFEQWVELGIFIPHRVMIKQEPHKLAKLLEKRPRNIFAESIVAQMAFRVLFSDLVDDAIENHESRPNKTGMGLHDQGLRALFEYAKKGLGASPPGVGVYSDDVGGWDTEVCAPLLHASAWEMYHELGLVDGTQYSNFFWNLLRWESVVPVASSNGAVFCFTMIHGQRSGSFITAYRNGKARRILSIAANIHSGRRYTPGGDYGFSMSMGDDTVESAPLGVDLVQAYASLGFRLTDVMQFTGKNFDFCSTLISENSGIPQKWAATLMRLLSHSYDDELYAQWRYEMRGLPEREILADFLLWLGWRPLVTPHGVPANQSPPFRAEGRGPQNMTKTKPQPPSVTTVTKKKQKKAPAAVPGTYTALVTDAQAMQRFSDKVRKGNEISVLPAMRMQSKPEGKELLKSMREPAPLAPRLDAYFRSLADPWAVPVKCPVNFNPVPSYMTSLARVTHTSSQLVVAASSTQLDLFPGHNAAGDEMDGVSYHTHPQAIGTVSTFIVGPVGDGARTPTIGVVTQQLGLNASQDLSNTAFSTPLAPNAQLPYNAANNNGGHTRWKLVSMGIDIENVTQLDQRSGYVAFVQPSSEFSGVTRAAYEVFSTYKESTKANTGTLRITWIPRPQDIAFWHSDASLNFSSMVGSGIRIWLINPSGASQSYRIFVVQNFEMAGSNLESLASKSIIQPADANVVSTTLGVLRTADSTAALAPRIGQVAAHAESPLAVPEHVVTHLTKGLTSAVKGTLAALF
jgi:hypothetical protein